MSYQTDVFDHDDCIDNEIFNIAYSYDYKKLNFQKKWNKQLYKSKTMDNEQSQIVWEGKWS